MTNSSQLETVLVFSGGLDSYVLAHELANMSVRFRGLYINFGKPVCQREMATVKRLALNLHLPVDYVDVSGLAALQSGYVPDMHIQRDELDVKEYEDIVKGISYTSGFQILLGIATYYSQIVGADSMSLGVIKDQSKSRPELTSLFAKMSEIAGILNPSRSAFQISTPYITKTKAEVIKTGSALGASIEESWSCMLAGALQCGVCGQCKSRRDAFKKAKVKDKTEYLS